VAQYRSSSGGRGDLEIAVVDRTAPVSAPRRRGLARAKAVMLAVGDGVFPDFMAARMKPYSLIGETRYYLLRFEIYISR
jgi:hypothetical protein